jgi:hypothetical protein
MLSPATTPITGSEDEIDPSRPEGALAEFYRAFNTRDLGVPGQAVQKPDQEMTSPGPLSGKPTS